MPARPTNLFSRQKWLAMRLMLTLLFTSLLQAQAHNGWSQNTVTLSFRNALLPEVFKAVQKQTGYSFAYERSVMQQAKRVSIAVINVPLREALDSLFREQPFGYEVEGRMVIVREKSVITANGGRNEGAEGLVDVRGVVLGENGVPLAGANVMVKGTSKGTSTNLKGEFSINKINEGGVLVFTSVGYNKKEVIVSGKARMVVQLDIAVKNLDELQIIAYGSTSRRLSTGNVTTVKAHDIEKQPVQNPILTLQGRVPGLVVTQNSGVPGGGVTVRIQGQNSIDNGNDPLYVIDGVPVPSQMAQSGLGIVLGESGTTGSKGNPLTFLDINSIESIDVLKDADATAIFGSRAANGAILITTKKPKVGRMSFQLNLQSGIGKVTRFLSMLDTRQYLDMRYEALKNDNISLNSLNQNGNYDLTVWDTTRYTDWQKELIGGTARFHLANVSVEAGTPNLQYRISSNYQKETTVFPGDWAFERGGLQISINSQSSNQKFTLQFSGSYQLANNQLPSTDLSRLSITMEPVAPAMYNSDGTINWAPNSSGISTFTDNPAIFRHRFFENKTDNLIGSLSLSYSLRKNLSIRANMGYTLLRSTELTITPLIAVRPENRSNPQARSANYGDRNQTSWTFEPQLVYGAKFQNHRVDLLIGSTLTSSRTSAGSIAGYDHLSDALLTNRSAASSLVPLFQTMSEYRYSGLFGRITYNYVDKYIVTTNIRRDGSSRFGDENKFKTFGSVACAWIFTQERIFANNKWLSFGKLTISYGTTGNDQVDDYNYFSLYSIQSASNRVLYQGIQGLNPSGLPNPYLQWEKTTKLQGGITLGFWNDRLLFTTNYGINQSSNQLLSYRLASTTGYTSIASNFPAKVQNATLELTVNTINIKIDKFQWNSSFNLTLPKNILKRFPDIESTSYANRLIIGQPLSIIRTLRFAGTDPSTGLYQFFSKDGDIIALPSSNDLTELVDISPKYYGGIENAITFGEVSLDFHFHFIKQVGPNFLLNNGTTLQPGRFSSGGSNQPIYVLERWQRDGDVSSIQKFSTRSDASTHLSIAKASSVAFSDASFVRLKNVAISYSFFNKIRKSVGLKNCKVYLNAQNLITLTSYKGRDPENQGINALPPLRMVTMGIQCNF